MTKLVKRVEIRLFGDLSGRRSAFHMLAQLCFLHYTRDGFYTVHPGKILALDFIGHDLPVADVVLLGRAFLACHCPGITNAKLVLGATKPSPLVVPPDEVLAVDAQLEHLVDACRNGMASELVLRPGLCAVA